MKSRFFPLTLVCFALLGAPVDAALEEAGYDPYTTQMAHEPSGSLSETVATEFLTWPFEIIRWPLNKTLYFVEENRIPTKTIYILDQLENKWGLRPKASFLSAGLDVELARLLKVHDTLPENLVANTWIDYSFGKNFETGATAGFKSAGISGFQAFGNFKYEDRTEESFFGIGPDSSQNEEAEYEMETTALEAITGYRHEVSLGIDAKFGYKHINISRGDDDEALIRDVNFLPGRNPTTGIHGDNLLNMGLETFWDPKIAKSNHLIPDKIRAGLDFVEGIGNSEARYLKFLAEISKEIKLFSERRSLAFHFFGEHNAAIGNGKVPFHQMPKLGGFGDRHHLSRTLRSYENNRFTAESAALFNFEYRYKVYQYRDFNVISIIFLDEGQTFQNLGRFQFKDFRESYGTGMRFNFLKHTLLDVEVAHGDEGTAFHVKSRQPF